jgi:hypothetical protein
VLVEGFYRKRERERNEYGLVDKSERRKKKGDAILFYEYPIITTMTEKEMIFQAGVSERKRKQNYF